MMKEPRGELARYAYGYSDKKPGIAFWLILLGMVIYIIFSFVTITEIEAAGADNARIEAEVRLVEHGVGRLFEKMIEERQERERVNVVEPTRPPRATRTMPKTVMALAIFIGLAALSYVALLSVKMGVRR